MEFLESIIILADELFDVDDNKPFGFKFWLSIFVWLIMLSGLVYSCSYSIYNFISSCVFKNPKYYLACGDGYRNIVSMVLLLFW
ncbi:hypothetical protein ACOWO9_07410 [Leuconostoc mesenteroides]|uniref:hypothetical protein n=1 Tax=Leuconostoc mesenteroides TaxID=1245 RepID=UPI003C5CE8B1